MDCLFCKICDNEMPSYTIYEDDIVRVFLDIHPTSPGEILIIPKKHVLDITDLDDKTSSHINLIAKKMYDLLKEKLNFDGLQLVQNNGCIQDIKHYHLHLIPFYKNKVNLSVEDIYKKIQN